MKWFDGEKKRILAAQDELIRRHCDEVENIYRQMRGWRHDYHNHLTTIQSLLESGEIEQCKAFCRQLDEDLATVDQVLKTGNVMLDAILNSKISLARQKKITVNTKAVVPKSLTITDVDLCVLVGNLLDNAIEACVLRERSGEWEGQQPFIRIYIGMKGKQLYICVTNTVFGRANKIGERFVSGKKEPGHGLGIMRMDQILRKYDAYCYRGSEEGAFSTEILISVGV